MISNVTISILHQLERHISQLTSEQYATRLEVFNGSSIGGHTRHVIEFYDCLLGSIETGIVNYDARKRDLEIENNRDYALSVINKIVKKWLDLNNFDKKIKLISIFGQYNLQTETTFQRETTYLIEHSIHHFALIRIGMNSCFEQVTVENEFGVAFSTLHYHNQNVMTF